MLYRLSIIIALIIVGAIPTVYGASVIIYPYHSYFVEASCNGNSFGGPVGAGVDADPRQYTLYRDNTGCYYSVDSYNLAGITGKSVSNANLNMMVDVSGACKWFLYDRDSETVTSSGSSFSCKDAEGMTVNPITVSGDQFGFDVILTHTKTTTTQKEKSTIMLDVDGTNCAWVASSRLCGFSENPWEAVKNILLYEYLGQWFYVLILLPIPMTVYLTTRNGAYAGFVSMGLMITFTQIDRIVFEVSLTMILISAGFLFYEVIRKRLFQSV